MGPAAHEFRIGQGCRAQEHGPRARSKSTAQQRCPNALPKTVSCQSIGIGPTRSTQLTCSQHRPVRPWRLVGMLRRICACLPRGSIVTTHQPLSARGLPGPAPGLGFGSAETRRIGMGRRGLAIVALLGALGPWRAVAAAETPLIAPQLPGNDYPTVVRADYVFGCMQVNGQTREALEPARARLMLSPPCCLTKSTRRPKPSCACASALARMRQCFCRRPSCGRKSTT